MARFRADEATCPSPWSWGFRARLAPEEAAAANATVSVHLLPDLAGYCAARLSSERRRKLRKGLSELDVVALRAPDILLEQGYGVALEAKGFSPGLRLAGPAAFRRWIMSYFAPERGLIVAGLEGGRLLGFCTNFAIDGTAYQDMLYVGAEGRRRHLALCLFHCSASIAGRDASMGGADERAPHARAAGGKCLQARPRFRSGLFADAGLDSSPLQAPAPAFSPRSLPSARIFPLSPTVAAALA